LTDLKNIRIVKVEERARDAWVDMSLRQLREGEVRFYRVKDSLTGEWLFKVCPDEEMHRTVIKALKCPPGRIFAQLEGSTMLFQESIIRDCYYDVISLSYIDENGRLRRNVVENIEEVPQMLRDNFKIVSYEEATGKKAIGKKLVTLCSKGDEKIMITLFLLERAWPFSALSPDLGVKKLGLLEIIRDIEKAEIDEVYQIAEERIGLSKEDVDKLLELMLEEGKILRMKEGYIKTRR